MLTILALLASFVTAPLPVHAEESGLDYAYHAYFNFTVTVLANEVVTVNLYDENGSLLDYQEFDYPGTFESYFDLGLYDGNVDEDEWRATCLWSGGSSFPFPFVAHGFAFPDDFTFVPKYWFHEFDF